MNKCNEELSRFVAMSGVLLSSNAIDVDGESRLVLIGTDQGVVEALAFGGRQLMQAFEQPLDAWALRLVYGNGSEQLPALVGLEADPYTDGLTLLPEAVCPVDGVVADIRALVACIQTPPLQAFVKKVLLRRDVFAKFWVMPASAKHHHARAGGLALHSLEGASDLAGPRGLTGVELDLGVAGALLHDIGKVWSYTSDMFLNAAGLAMGHELVGLSRIEPELTHLEGIWPDGAYTMRAVLSGQARMRENGSLPTSLLARIKACDQRSCERDRAVSRVHRASIPAWVPRAWKDPYRVEEVVF